MTDSQSIWGFVLSNSGNSDELFGERSVIIQEENKPQPRSFPT